LDLHKAAKLANTPLYAFLKLNPGFNRSSTAPEGPHRLLVPVDQVQAFKKNLAMLPYSERVTIKQFDEERVAYIRPQEKHEEKPGQLRWDSAPKTLTTQYKFKYGDNLASIANRNNTTIKTLRMANNLDSNSVRSGMHLQIPSEANSKNISSFDKASKTKSASAQVYAVKKGDTFFNISQRFSVTPKDIANWNNTTLKSALIPGRKLTIKSVNPQLASASSSIRLVSYTVMKGDSLIQISRKFNVSTADLRKSNAATLVKGLRPGQKLKIIVDNNQSSS
jgi:membrane-bound lytic murein transglycosylase D